MGKKPEVYEIGETTIKETYGVFMKSDDGKWRICFLRFRDDGAEIFPAFYPTEEAAREGAEGFATDDPDHKFGFVRFVPDFMVKSGDVH